MKNWNNIPLSLFLILILLTGCTYDYERNLGGDYVITGYEKTTVISKEIPGRVTEYKEVLLGEIVDCDFDRDFIIVYREVSEEARMFWGDHPYSEIFRGGDSTQFWIIQKNSDVIYGPLNKNEYLDKRNELRISDNIKLHNE